MNYPKAIRAENIRIGQRVVLFMTHNGTERAKHGCEFDDWCVLARVKSIDRNVVTVGIDDRYKNTNGCAFDTVSFYINNRFHEVGKSTPDFRLFLSKEDAQSYEYYRAYSQAYHDKHKARRNQSAREYQKANSERIRERKKKYRHENPELISLRQQQYVRENKDRLNEYHRKYREENRKEINRRQNARRRNREERQETNGTYNKHPLSRNNGKS